VNSIIIRFEKFCGSYIFFDFAEFFGEHKPARIVVPSGKLHFGCLVEIEAVAEVTK